MISKYVCQLISFLAVYENFHLNFITFLILQKENLYLGREVTSSYLLDLVTKSRPESKLFCFLIQRTLAIIQWLLIQRLYLFSVFDFFFFVGGRSVVRVAF